MKGYGKVGEGTGEGRNTTGESSGARMTKSIERCGKSEESGHGSHYLRAEGGKGKGNHSCEGCKGKSRPEARAMCRPEARAMCMAKKTGPKGEWRR